MVKVILTVIGNNEEIEGNFWRFIENQEFCTVQPDFEQNEDGVWEATLIPEWDEEFKEFFELCGELVTFFNELGYQTGYISK